MGRRFYRPEIDGLRCIAVLVVILYHGKVPGFSGGFVGVDVFFVISGFLIAKIVSDDLQAGRFSLLDFFEKRLRKLFPALFVMVAACVALGPFMLGLDALRSLLESVPWQALFLQNFYFFSQAGYFDSAGAEKALLHTWTLGVEWSFYLVIPFLLMVVRGRALRLAVLGISALSLICSIVVTAIYPELAFYMLPTRVWEFMFGAGVVLFAVSEPRFPVGTSLLGLALIAVSVVFYDPGFAYPGAWALAPCAGTALVIYGNKQLTSVGKLLASPVPRFIGRISYSAYLWHWPILVFARQEFGTLGPLDLVACLILTVAAAYLSWRYIEEPFVRKRVLLSSRRFAATAVLGASMMTAFSVPPVPRAALAVYYDSHILEFLREYRDYPEQTLVPWKAGSCFLLDTDRTEEIVDRECLARSNDRVNVLLWGDSFAAQYRPGLDALLPGSRYNLMQATKSGCVPILGLGGTADCAAVTRSVRAFIDSRRPEVVIVAARWDSYLAGQDDIAALQELAAWLESRNIRTLIVGEVPTYRIPVTDMVAQAQSLDVDTSPYFQGTALDIGRRIQSALRGLRYVQYVPVIDDLCERQRCRVTTTSGRLIQYDTGHLTLEGSRLAARLAFGDIFAAQ